MESRNYKIWLSVIDERRCGNCERKQGKLIPVNAVETLSCRRFTCTVGRTGENLV